jgi:hypothetical protein
MNGNLACTKGIVWYATGALVRIVVGAAPNVGISVGRVQLAGREEFHVTVVETIERQINRPGPIDGGNRVTDFRRLTDPRLAVRERARGRSDVWVILKGGVLAADDRGGGEMEEGEEEKGARRMHWNVSAKG